MMRCVIGPIPEEVDFTPLESGRGQPEERTSAACLAVANSRPAARPRSTSAPARR